MESLMLAWAGRGRDVRQQWDSGVFASFIWKAYGAGGGQRGPSFQRREEPLGGFGKQAADERREDEPARDAPLRHLSAPDSIDVSLVPSH